MARNQPVSPFPAPGQLALSKGVGLWRLRRAEGGLPQAEGNQFSETNVDRLARIPRLVCNNKQICGLSHLHRASFLFKVREVLNHLLRVFWNIFSFPDSAQLSSALGFLDTVWKVMSHL